MAFGRVGAPATAEQVVGQRPADPVGAERSLCQVGRDRCIDAVAPDQRGDALADRRAVAVPGIVMSVPNLLAVIGQEHPGVVAARLVARTGQIEQLAGSGRPPTGQMKARSNGPAASIGKQADTIDRQCVIWYGHSCVVRYPSR